MSPGFSALIDQYQASLAQKHRLKPDTIALYSRRLAVFAQYLVKTKCPLPKLAIRDLEAFVASLAAQNVPARTINQHIVVLKDFCQFLTDSRTISQNIALPLTKKAPPQRKTISKAAATRFIQTLDAAQMDRRLIFIMMILLGLNSEDLSSLRKADIRLEKDALGIKRRRSKEFDFFRLDNHPLAPLLVEALKIQMSVGKVFLFETKHGHPLSRPHIWQLFTKVQSHIPEPCDSPLMLKNPQLRLEKCIELDESVQGEIAKRFRLKKSICQTKATITFSAIDQKLGTDIEVVVLDPKHFSEENLQRFKNDFAQSRQPSHPTMTKALDYYYAKKYRLAYFSADPRESKPMEGEAPFNQPISVHSAKFVGRINELAILADAFGKTFHAQSKPSQNHFVFIRGEAGIGKRRLLAEIETQASLAEVRVAHIELKKGAALETLVDACQRLDRPVSVDSKGFEQEGLALELAVNQNIAQNLFHFLRRAPTLLIFSHAEEFTGNALISLRLLCDRLIKKHSPLLLVFCENGDAAKPGSLKKNLLALIPSHCQVVELSLPLFSPAETARLTESLLAEIPGPSLVNTLFEITGGLPGSIVTILKNLCENKFLFRQDQMIHCEKVGSDFSKGDLSMVAKNRLRRISPKLCLILYILSHTKKTRVEPDLLLMLATMVPQRSERQLQQDLVMLRENHYIVMSSENETEEFCGLASSLLADHVSKSLPKHERQKIHLELAQYFENLPQGADPMELADHYFKGGEYETAVRLFMEIARRAETQGLFEQARQAYLKAINSLGPLDSGSKLKEVVDTNLLLLRVYLRLSEMDSARALATRLEKEPLEFSQQMELLALQGQLSARVGDLDGAITQYDRAIALTSNQSIIKNQDKIIELHFLKAIALVRLARYINAEKTLDDTSVFHHLFSQSQAAQAHNLSGMVAFYRGRCDAAIEHYQKSLAAAEETSDAKAKMRALNQMGMVFQFLSEFKKAAEHFERALEAAEIACDVYGKVRIYQNLGIIHLQMGEFATALAILAKAHAMFNALGNPREYEFLLMNLGLAHAQVGDFEGADTFLLRAEEFAAKRKNSLAEAYVLALQAYVSSYKGNVIEALSQIEGAIQSFELLDNKDALVEVHNSAALILISLGRIDEAVSVLARHPADIHRDTKVFLEQRLIEVEIALRRNRLDVCSRLMSAELCAQSAKLSASLKLSYLRLQLQIHIKKGQADLAKDSTAHLQTFIDELKAQVPLKWQLSFLAQPHIKLAREVIAEAVRLSGFSAGKPENKWEQILDVNQLLLSSQSPTDMTRFVLDFALLISGAQGGFFSLTTDLVEALDLGFTAIPANQATPNPSAFKVVQTKNSLPSDCLAKSMAIEARGFSQLNKVETLETGSVYPIPIQNEIIGFIFLIPASETKPASFIDPVIMKAFSAQVGLAFYTQRQLFTLTKAHQQAIAQNDRLAREVLQKQDHALQVEATLATRSRQDSQERDYLNMVTQDAGMLKIFETIQKIKDSDIPVLITGESGVGKELIARAIHYGGRRMQREFFAENCGALVPTLLESELFGFVKGAFTGAMKDKRGIFELADGGSVFLDELGEMSLPMQAALLRVLQDGRIRRVGATSWIRTDVRIICATNSQLSDLLKENRFRQDLYFRIKGLEIKVPPLRDRIDDIPLLVDHFLAKQNPLSPKKMSDDLLLKFKGYAWPGNVRELANEVKKLAVLAPTQIIDEKVAGLSPMILDPLTHGKFSSLAQIETTHIKEVYLASGKSRTQTARILGISKKLLNSHLKRLKIQ